MQTRLVIIGSDDDVHVQAVRSQLGASVLVLDASSLSSRRYSLSQGTFRVHDDSGDFVVQRGVPTRGWIRRLAPPDWHHGVTLESKAGVVKSAWLALLSGIIRTCGVEWLTPLDPLLGAESKLVQERAAAGLGISTPQSVVTNDAAIIRQRFEDLILKPLAAGQYFEKGAANVIFATPVEARSPIVDAVAGAPFLAQERVRGERHLRVVTVLDQVWAAAIPADAHPVDWRQDRQAHRSFVATVAPDAIIAGARRIAHSLQLGYSSQDWLVGADGSGTLLDVNPSGQWLFLPPEIAHSVSSAIANWLRSRT